MLLFFHFLCVNVPENKCHKQKWHVQFFTCIKLVAHVLAFAHAITCILYVCVCVCVCVCVYVCVWELASWSTFKKWCHLCQTSVKSCCIKYTVEWGLLLGGGVGKIWKRRNRYYRKSWKNKGVRKPQPTMICVIKPEFPLLVTVAFA